MGLFVASRPLFRPASPGILFAGFIAGVSVQLQQPALWPAGLYAALAALAVAMALGLYCARVLKRVANPASWGMGLAVFVMAALLGFGLTGWRAGAFQSTALNPALEAFLGQDKDDHTSLSDSFTQLEAILNQGMIQ